MNFDGTVSRAPAAPVRLGTAASAYAFEGYARAPGDVAVLSAALDGTGAVSAAHIIAPGGIMLGTDVLEDLITDCEYNRVRAQPGTLTDASFCNMAIDDAAFDGVLPVRLGGTGLSGAALGGIAAGALVVGGGSDPLAAAGLLWDAAGGSAFGALKLPEGGGVSFDGEFAIMVRDGKPCVETEAGPGGRVSVDLSDLAPSPLPSVELVAVTLDAADANAGSVAWTVYHDDSALDRVHFCLVDAASSSWAALTEPYEVVRTATTSGLSGSTGTPPQLAAPPSSGSGGSRIVAALLLDDLSPQAISAQRAAGTFGVDGMSITHDYTLLTVVTDAIGNMSPINRAPMRPMSYAEPDIITMDAVVTDPAWIRLGAINVASIANTRLTVGLLDAGNPAVALDVAAFDAYVEAVRGATGGSYPFVDYDIPWGAEVDAYPTLHAAALWGATGPETAAVAERGTYVGFFLYKDSAGNGVRFTVPGIYNPDVTAPLLGNLRINPAGITEVSIPLVWDAIVDA